MIAAGKPVVAEVEKDDIGIRWSRAWGYGTDDV
jgi:hypothetical protein